MNIAYKLRREGFPALAERELRDLASANEKKIPGLKRRTFDVKWWTVKQDVSVQAQTGEKWTGEWHGVEITTPAIEFEIKRVDGREQMDGDGFEVVEGLDKVARLLSAVHKLYEVKVNETCGLHVVGTPAPFPSVCAY